MKSFRHISFTEPFSQFPVFSDISCFIHLDSNVQQKKITMFSEYEINTAEIKEDGGKGNEMSRGCLGVTVDDLGDMTVGVLLVNVPSISTLPRANPELGQQAGSQAMSD